MLTMQLRIYSPRWQPLKAACAEWAVEMPIFL